MTSLTHDSDNRWFRYINGSEVMVKTKQMTPQKLALIKRTILRELFDDVHI